MYAARNFPTKKALKEAIDAGQQIGFYQPGPFGGKEPKDGTIALEGPWYPKPHSWYATAVVKGGYIVKVK